MYAQMKKIEKVNNSSLWQQDAKVRLPKQYIQPVIGYGNLRYEEIVLDNNNPKINIRETEGELKIENPEKLATQGTQDEEKQNKNKTKHVLVTTIRILNNT